MYTQDMNASQKTIFDMVQVWLIADKCGARTANFSRIEYLTLKVRDVLNPHNCWCSAEELDLVIDRLQQFWSAIK